MKFAMLTCILYALVAMQSTAAQIRGSVASTTGKAFESAVAALSTSETSPPFATVNVDANGSFLVTTERTGRMVLTIAAAHHKAVQRSLYIATKSHDLTLNATLGTNRTASLISVVKIVGDFNKWNFENAPTMKLNSDGTYSHTVPAESGAVKYQILLFEAGSNPEGGVRSINGTQHTRLEYDGGGDFWSVFETKNARQEITFNPAVMPVGDGQSKVSFQDAGEQELQQLTASISDPMPGFRKSVGSRATDMQSFFTLVQTEVAPNEIAMLHGKLATENTSSNRQIIVAKILSLLEYSSVVTAADSALVRRIMSEIPNGSPVWSLAMNSVVEGYVKVGLAPQAIQDLREVVGGYGSEGQDVLAWGMYSLCRGTVQSNTELFSATYAQLLKEFPKHGATKNAMNEWDPSKKVVVGKSLPEFSYPSLDDPSVVVSPASLRGKWVFIDLWATWCGPCIAEMPTIMKAWEEFKNDNISFLSISLDQSVEKIAPFRAKRFAMPWLHIFREGVFSSDASTLFEVTGIPKPILVSPDGVIKYITEGLRGPALLTTLQRVLRGQ